ncbi:hypothetical protein FSP39_009130 [Pinctada imbricata]|uniref:Mab-21-like HhH/H2TH-like domain-containing protein n=1 Tax=Pinctada imbricata TaxID=66713 RepID=A0AA89BTA8_PINIB|nr:hypothetical protein FSP39_009130 [Pinctada imbricata]
MRHISEGLYHVMSIELGHEDLISVRRFLFESMCKKCGNMDYLISGSRAEGFQFTSSDFDIMYVLNSSLYHVEQGFKTGRERLNKETIMEITLEYDWNRPGFAWLQLNLNATTDMKPFCIEYQNRYYLSSTVWREYFGQCISGGIRMSQRVQGPVVTTWSDTVEVDNAICLKSDEWPQVAKDCIYRLHKRGWPSTDVLEEMVKYGCILVPIGAKESQFHNLQWRLSFSMAEKTLCHSMSHAQFLTYGLLKIFLKEVINSNTEVKDLLCSYFLKTAVFWEIVSDTREWSPCSFLSNFWRCFERLLRWVRSGYCPNFFVPENNMFLHKVYGKGQVDLLAYLSSLYKEGPDVLLRSCSLKTDFSHLLSIPDSACQAFSLIDERNKADPISDLLLPLENFQSASFPTLLGLIRSRKYDSIQVVCELAYLVRLNFACFQYLCANSSYRTNKFKYHLMKVLKLSGIDTVRNLSFLAIYMYRCKQYTHTIRLAKAAMKKVNNSHYMYDFNFSLDEFISFGCEYAHIQDMMRKHVIASKILLNSATCVPELAEVCAGISASIPVVVMLYFLLFLSYIRMQEFAQAKFYFEELSRVILTEEDLHGMVYYRDIIVKILKLCKDIFIETSKDY